MQQRQQEMSDEVERLRAENDMLVGEVNRLESLLGDSSSGSLSSALLKEG